MKRLVLALVAGMAVCACSSKPPVKGYMEDEILSTSNDKSQPSWADETKPFYIEDGKVYSVGLTTLRGDERPEAGMRISENNARANIARAIQNRMEFIFQNAEENSDYDSRQARYIGSEVSSLTSSAITVQGHWYKRYATSDEDGSRRIVYKIYSLVTMPEDELKKAINKAVNHRVVEQKLSPTFQEQVDRHWDKFIEVKSDQPAPASVSTDMKGDTSVKVKEQEVNKEKPVSSIEPEVRAENAEMKALNDVVEKKSEDLVKAVVQTAIQGQ